ncbi:asparagine synthase (glutamine-hydrolyzing) [Gayadomonas joobiniege]|uniref:asparagine synthase (glutamine-hydrolyzing) n=1 Tax=Gayadomonas joobiniege TaxID=1234606 RepID=UPI00037AA985|nr:asparagine synthase (glutamine-hydrolyzing) [Gayadomonas joobiniege]
MCGIAGFTRYQYAGDENTLMTMGQAIAHRGPDAQGTFLEERIGLCHQRLSILDLSDAGRQPMHTSDGRYSLVFNGEIYNFLDLRETLESSGYRFHSHTDSEVILAAYQAYGHDCVKQLNGMFAFAVWDKQQQELFIARDRLGKKPLYYYFDGSDLFFASELKALMAAGCIPKQIRTDAVYDFFAYQYIPDPKTIFAEVYKLEPGHYLSFKQGEIKCHSYWHLDFSKKNKKNAEQQEADLLALIKDCTKSRMLADVPLGAFLSGGVDSSGIVALMAEQSPTPVTTCSIGFDVQAFNETEFAKAVAEAKKTDHHEFFVNQQVADSLADIVGYFDEPFADPSLVPTYYVSQLARQKVTVALSGDGGDEIFAGYEKYAIDAKENQIRNQLPKWFNQHIAGKLAKLVAATPVLKQTTTGRKAVTLLKTLASDPATGFYHSNAFITDEVWQTLVKPDRADELAGYHPSQITTDKYHQANADDHLSKILYTDIKTFLPGGILTKVDRMSMANSLEVRAPLLDYQVVEYAVSLPSHQKLKDGDKKHILKNILKPLLPSEILTRKKMGFSVPLAQWLREDLKNLAEDKILKNNPALTSYFRQQGLALLWRQHQAGTHDHSSVLWSLLMFQMWWDHYICQPSSGALDG